MSKQNKTLLQGFLHRLLYLLDEEEKFFSNEQKYAQLQREVIAVTVQIERVIGTHSKQNEQLTTRI